MFFMPALVTPGMSERKWAGQLPGWSDLPLGVIMTERACFLVRHQECRQLTCISTLGIMKLSSGIMPSTTPTNRYSPAHLCADGAQNVPAIWSAHVQSTDCMLLEQCEIRDEHGKQSFPNMWDGRDMVHKWVGLVSKTLLLACFLVRQYAQMID